MNRFFRNTRLIEENETLREVIEQVSNNEEILQERLAELELALEDANWMRLMMEGEHEFSRDGIRRIAELARVMFLKNPLVKRSVMVQALYVWAQGMSVRSKNIKINQVLQDFWDDEKNRAELTSHQARMLKEIDLQVEGNIFFIFFTRPTDGRVRVRSVPPDEISQIVTDPEDAKSPWYYVRNWSKTEINPGTGRKKTTQHKAYYPDWRYHPKKRPDKIGSQPVMWESPIYHIKVGAFSGWKFGLSETYASIDWARAYKDFLEDVASLMRAYSRFAWRMTTRGGKKGVTAAKAKLGSTLGDTGTSSETNPGPVTGSTFIGADGINMEPIHLRGASIAPEDGRRFLLMVAAAAGLPETFYGDVSVGTLATGKTLDRPTELMFRNRQELWTEIFRDIFNFILLQSAKAGESLLKDIVSKIEKIEDGDEIEERVVWEKGVSAHLDIDFPPILERDVQAAVQAITTAATMNGQDLAIFDEPTVARLLLTALAQDDVDEIMADLYPEEGEGAPARAAQTDDDMPSEARVRAAAEKLLEAFGLREKRGEFRLVG